MDEQMDKQRTGLLNSIFSIQSSEEFENASMAVFKYQAIANPVYRRYLKHLDVQAESVKAIEEIPFLPIEFFKSEWIYSGYKTAELIFSSSSTTGQIPSRHYVHSAAVYRSSFTKAFRRFYGSEKDLCVLALLPGYLERKDSSLVYMMQELISNSGHPFSGFYLNDYNKLEQHLRELRDAGQKTLLIGVSFALLDFVDKHAVQFSELILMETGGMKGRGPELIRSDLHEKIKNGFGISQVHSEYGMTELLSQAYSSKEGLFSGPPWFKVLVREMNDPFSYANPGKTGGLNIIDLANLDSCAFLETQDLGRIHTNGQFEVLGRFDASDVRGCNLMF